MPSWRRSGGGDAAPELGVIDYSRFRHRVHLYVNLRARRPLLHGKSSKAGAEVMGLIKSLLQPQYLLNRVCMSFTKWFA